MKKKFIFYKFYLLLKLIYLLFFRKTKDLYFFSREVYIENINDKKFDRIVDPILDLIPKKFTYEKVYIGSTNKSLNNFFQSINIPNNNFFNIFFSKTNSKFIDKNLIKNLRIIIDHINISFNPFMKYLIDNFNEFRKWEKIFSFFLYKKKIKHIFVTSFYFPDMLALIYAANKKGIKTIELQHGKQGEYQAMYNWSEIKSSSINFLPSNFWCWGIESANTINKSFPDNQIAKIVGYPWLKFVKLYLDKNKKDDFFHNNNKYVILFSLQSPKNNKMNLFKFSLIFRF